MAHGRRRHRGGHEGGHENAERWLLTYADLITLLMVFFVVLYSMSQADSAKFQAISAALEKAFNTDVFSGTAPTTVTDGTAQTSAPIEVLPNQDLQSMAEVARLKAQLERALAGNEQAPDVQVATDQEGVVIRLSGSYLFDSGRAELKPNSLAVLDAVAAEVRGLPNDVRVEGHTDGVPIQSARYPTNWELSAARAVSVTRYLVETDHVAPPRVTAAGYGEFRPLVPNDTREHRATNRRVEIHLLSSSRSGANPPGEAPANEGAEAPLIGPVPLAPPTIPTPAARSAAPSPQEHIQP